MRPTRSASFCNLVTFSCPDRNYATDASNRLRFGDITKYMCSKHSAKFGVSRLKNEVTGYFFIMGKSFCRTLYVTAKCANCPSSVLGHAFLVRVAAVAIGTVNRGQLIWISGFF